MAKTDFFWSDIQQATERLHHSVVLYDDKPVYVLEVFPANDDVPRARLVECNPDRKETRKMLNSPKFSRFRELPKLGWMNVYTSDYAQATKGAVLLARHNVAVRTHGLADNNVRVSSFSIARTGDDIALGRGAFHFHNFFYDKGFEELHKGLYPALEKILANIRVNSAIAYSRNYCVVRDGNGIRWLYRGETKVGLFTGVDTLNLFSKSSFLREEIMEDPAFTLNNIREF